MSMSDRVSAVITIKFANQVVLASMCKDRLAAEDEIKKRGEALIADSRKSLALPLGEVINWNITSFVDGKSCTNHTYPANYHLPKTDFSKVIAFAYLSEDLYLSAKYLVDKNTIFDEQGKPLDGYSIECSVEVNSSSSIVKTVTDMGDRAHAKARCDLLIAFANLLKEKL